MREMMGNNVPVGPANFASGKLTICEVLREINDLHQGDGTHNEKVRRLVATSINMAKRMSMKLMEYSKSVFDDWWNENKDYEEDLKRRLSPDYKIAEKKEFNKALIAIADRIPHMGAGNIKDWLMQSAANVNEKYAIVELGAWMGSGTAYLSIGSNGKNKIYVYDHFRANVSEVEKANKSGVKLSSGIDTLPIVTKNLKSFKTNIIFKKCDVYQAKWNNKKIGLFVDDVSKSPEAWKHTVKEFLPYVVIGSRIILMDYFYFEKTKNDRHKTQFNFMQKNKKYFRFVMRNPNGSEAMFAVIKKYPKEKKC